ncbi:MAG: TIGR01777 family protein [Candidatus Omnitrophica bacterium]|nr:TIGR01777 family protein [Candidatus Omnitrophota bacterium]
MMRIAITGSRGLVGTALVEYFARRGHVITRIVHQDKGGAHDPGAVVWDIPSRQLEPGALAGHEVVIHLAGAGIADHRWTENYKRLIYSSRVDGTSLLSQTLAKVNPLPKLLISASAVGFYGHIEPPSYSDERSVVGKLFLSHVCEKWEQSTNEAHNVGIRIIHMRLGLVLSKKGGALSKMLPVFKLGLGGRIGSGRQMVSWVALEEIPLIVEHMMNSNLSGPVNAVSPHPVSNAEFTATLAKCLNRPAAVPVPAPAVRILFGEMGEELLLSGAKVVPTKLTASGYRFRYPELETALQHIL